MATTKNRTLTRLIDAGRVVRGKAKTKHPTPTNHVVLVLDESGSMSGIRNDAARSFEQQVESIRTEARKARQKVSVHTITFNGTVREPRQDFNVASYRPDGFTALWRAISEALTFGNGQRNVKNNDTLLVVVVTDGAENASVMKKQDIQRQIGDAITDENVSIVANVPPGHNQYLIDIGIPAFNIREWEASTRGVSDLTLRSSSGYTGYFSARRGGATGQSATASLMANMDAVTPGTVNNMKDVSTDFKRFRVENADEGREISDFVRSKGVPYAVGRAFYELTKPEKVSAKKDLLILDKQTGAIYAGSQARTKLGLPLNRDIRLKPGTHGEFSLFVESTSYNRHLVGGTTLLYRI